MARKVLLVDDNRINRRIMANLFGSLDVDVVEAKDGYEAIGLIKKEKFMMVFMDILMPKLNGFETTKFIRKLQSDTGFIPVVAVTASDDANIAVDMLGAGFNHILKKPVRITELKELIDKYTSNDSLDFNAPEFEKFMSDKALQDEILKAVIEEENKDKKRIKDAFKSKDQDKIYKAVHYMKGTFSYIKADKMFELSKKILKHSIDKEYDKVLSLEEEWIHNYELLLDEIIKYKDSL